MSDGIGHWIVRHAQRHPAAVAVIDAESGRKWTYAELNDESSSVAAALQARGLQRGDRIALLMDNCPQLLTLVIAAAKLGAITVPINFRLAAAEVSFILSDSGSRLFAISARHSGVATAAVQGQPIIDVDSEAWSELTGEAPLTPLPDVALTDICVVMYTSGTTGVPKGAVLTHSNMLWNAINMVTVSPGLSRRDVTIAAAPLFHIGALGLSALPLFYVGGTVVVQNSFDPQLMLERMREYAVTTQFLVSAMWAAMTKVPGMATTPLPAMRYAFSGGAPCPLAVIEFFLAAGWTFLEGFGMTETAPTGIVLDAEDVVAHAGSVGKPVFHFECQIVDDEGVPVSAGTVGELTVKGPNVFAGYWGRPEATAAAFRNGWFHTGDLGFADAEGFITLVDRKKDMIITGGENVYPIEVERVLQLHPAIDDCAVIGVPDAKWGETVLAVVVTTDEVSAASLLEFTRDQIAHFKCPTRVEFVDVLPRNATGKLLKRELRERYNGAAAAVSR